MTNTDIQWLKDQLLLSRVYIAQLRAEHMGISENDYNAKVDELVESDEVLQKLRAMKV